MGSIGGLPQSTPECANHQHDPTYMAWCTSLDGRKYFECLYCKRILIDHVAEDVQEKQFELLQKKIASLEKALGEARNTLQKIEESCGGGSKSSGECLKRIDEIMGGGK